MAPRAYWKGYFRVSLVSFKVRLYNAVAGSERMTLNQLHRGCNTRLKFPPACPIHGQVDRSEIAKAYEVDEGKYIIIEPEELEAIKLRTERTIEIDSFTPAEDVDEIYLESPYYLAPDGGVAESPFRVIHEALRKTRCVAIGRVTLSAKEHPILVRNEDRGMLLSTLRSAREVRAGDTYFAEIGKGKVSTDQLDMAVRLIEGMKRRFEPSQFHDRYQDALRKLVESKARGREPVVVQEDELPTTLNFAAALKASLEGEGKPAREGARRRKPPAKSVGSGRARRRKSA